MKMSGLPLYRRALKQPENVSRVVAMMKEQGVAATVKRVRGKLDSGIATGYSAAGEVVAVGDSVQGLHVGDRVACAGAGVANHAEVIDVPVNLCANIPPQVETRDAATVTLGSIAMQGVRRANPTLGETFVVLGLGILGQLTVQLLKASGCHVVGADIESQRISLALDAGMDEGSAPSRDELLQRVLAITDGFGADGVIVTAASTSDEVISVAAQATRKKGRVVLVGDVGLGLQRSDWYNKELDFLVSTSYGPGRYDPYYEVEGQDYPIAYVRWTEQRNMQAYLRLLANSEVSLAHLPQETFAVDAAPAAYQRVSGDGKKPMLVFLDYPQRSDVLSRTVKVAQVRKVAADSIGVGVAGAGSFAQGVHIPNIMKLNADFSLRSVHSKTGANATAVARQFQVALATTDYDELLRDADIDLLLIATRHDSHAALALRALQAGKHVLVEKPLAMQESELQAIEEFYAEFPHGPVLMTGFNRRFSPAMRQAARILKNRATPLVLNYRMNAGFIPADHWVQGSQGGGRNIGEACHIYDLFNYFTGAEVVDVKVSSLRPRSKQWMANDNFIANVSYDDGSICSLTYTALGNTRFPKERMEIYADSTVLYMDNFKSLSATGGTHKGWSSQTVEKGHFEELLALRDTLKTGGDWPISLADQLSATRISLEVERQIA
jgi:predicted dehydrogenase/threonine dehydrogenase-like Zn-dependent dehydrogenase